MKNSIIALSLFALSGSTLAAGYADESLATLTTNIPAVCGVAVELKDSNLSDDQKSEFVFWTKNNTGSRTEVEFAASTDLRYVHDLHNKDDVKKDIKVRVNYQKHNQDDTLDSIRKLTIENQNGQLEPINMTIDMSDINVNNLLAGTDQKTRIVADIICK
ncbi:hypothetical protein [Vibrio maritimus]|uniref:hypothetical protein n=1 Tax=Vibrio maritimus TaxID=990268 RepID=UPI001F48845B|nr:hypothetical protein [Vibrio maritimus]